MRKHASKKLSLHKETIANLNADSLDVVAGGVPKSRFFCRNTGIKNNCLSQSCDAMICIPF